MVITDKKLTKYIKSVVVAFVKNSKKCCRSLMANELGFLCNIKE